MKSVPLLLALLLCTALVAGCSGKKSEPPPTTSSPTPTPTQTTSTTTTTPPPPPPKELANLTFSYGKGTPPANDPAKTVAVDAKVVSLEIWAATKLREAQKPSTLKGDQQPTPDHANLTLRLTGGNVSVIVLDDITAQVGEAGEIVHTYSFMIAQPSAGAMTVEIHGTGVNVDAQVGFTEKFA